MGAQLGSPGVSVVGVKRPLQVAVVIPTLDEESRLPACLRAIYEAAAGVSYEVVVADGGSQDATVDLARSMGASVVQTVRGRSVQMNAGARSTSAPILLFVHADTRLSPGSMASMVEALCEPGVVGGSFTLRFDCTHPLLCACASLTRLPLTCLRYGDQGFFVRRPVFFDLGGFPEVPLMEDVAFFRRLSAAGQTTLVDRPATTSARRFLDHGVVRQQFRNVWLVLLYWLGVSPERLARHYEGRQRAG